MRFHSVSETQSIFAAKRRQKMTASEMAPPRQEARSANLSPVINLISG
jgi:hypothetical protein